MKFQQNQSRKYLRHLSKKLDNEGILEEYKYLNRLMIPFDGTQYFKSNKVNCGCCLTKEHQNGIVTYHHNVLATDYYHVKLVKAGRVSCLLTKQGIFFDININ